MRRLFLLALLIATAAVRPAAQVAPPAPAQLPADVAKAFTYRNLGPFRAGSWIADIAVPDAPQTSHLYTMYVAVRYGGLWKTTNNGTTFSLVFPGESTSSMGCVAVAPSNENIVWLGTGDASQVRVSMPGDGVYKSIDAGKTWQKMGLPDAHHIARIVIHPTKPDIVYVAAMGHLWSPNEERGIFKTTDGGKTWAKALYINDKTGVIDLVINRKRPDILFAATYEVQRYPWRLVEGGAGTGIHKTTDGGKTWMRLAGGLPQGPVGRIGLDLYQKNPDIVYAVLENLARRPPTEDERKQDEARKVTPRDRLVGGEVYRTDDGGRTWRKMNASKDDVSNKAGYSFNQVRVDQNNDQRILLNQDSLLSSEDGGRTWSGLNWNSRNLFANAFGDFRTMWIDPQNSNRIIMGSDGGVHVSYDGGKTCDHYANLPGGEYYAISVDMDDPYRIYGGLQDHDSWRGPIDGWSGRVNASDWITVGDNDGMYNQVDPTDSRWVYNTVQWGGHYRLDQKSYTRKSIVPTRPAGQPPLRFNWTPPIRLSPHNSQILYTGAQVLFRSFDRGDHWEEISPDLTTNDASKISPPGRTVQYCTITTISESPVKAGILWVGADDGKVQVTQDHGATWSDVTPKIAAAGGAADYWVTRVLASAYAPGTAYVTKSGHRFDKYEPLVFKTTDFGATWTAIQAGLPAGQPANVVVEDTKDRDILFVGTMGGVHVTLDGGRTWTALKGNMPVVSVTDMVIHPRENDLVAATYGRGLWVGNVAWLREAKAGAFGEDVHFFAVQAVSQPGEPALGNYQMYGDRQLYVPNEEGARLIYYLREKPAGKVTLVVANAAGQTVRTLESAATAGLNVASWNLRAGRAGVVPPGEYSVTLQVGDRKLTQKMTVRAR
ncbi:MAG: VPS10 domain-containing protein [Bacteroidales bacterium]